MSVDIDSRRASRSGRSGGTMGIWHFRHTLCPRASSVRRWAHRILRSMSHTTRHGWPSTCLPACLRPPGRTCVVRSATRTPPRGRMYVRTSALRLPASPTYLTHSTQQGTTVPNKMGTSRKQDGYSATGLEQIHHIFLFFSSGDRKKIEMNIIVVTSSTRSIDL